MRKSRNALVAAAVGIGAVFSTASIALADGASQNESTIEAGISPNGQSATKPGRATLFSQVQTFDNTGGPLTIVDKAAERVSILFDNDMTINTAHFATCGGQGGNDLDADTSQQAIESCPSDSLVGSGQAEALIPTGVPASPVARLELTITTFNGPTTVAGGACTAPADHVGGPEGCEYIGGLPQIILHAYNQGLAFITTVGGEVQPVTDDVTADYGQKLVVNDAPDTAGDAGSLILFNSTVGRTLVDKVKKHGVTKTKLYDYVKATCGDDGAAAGGKEYDFKGNWVYDDGTTDTDTFKQKCGNPTS
jgi:hypothetical protein